jgi:hypothetical protein
MNPGYRTDATDNQQIRRLEENWAAKICIQKEKKKKNIMRVIFVIYYTDYGRKDRSRPFIARTFKNCYFNVLAFFQIVLFAKFFFFLMSKTCTRELNTICPFKKVGRTEIFNFKKLPK